MALDVKKVEGRLLVRGRPFQPGNQYGRVRPRGSRNKLARACQDILETHAQKLMEVCVYKACQGNTTAMRLCVERLLPARRHRALQFKLPALKTIADVNAASESVVNGVARGQLTPEEGESLTQMLEGRRRVIETQELEQRIRVLEQSNDTTNSSYGR